MSFVVERRETIFSHLLCTRLILEMVDRSFAMDHGRLTMSDLFE